MKRMSHPASSTRTRLNPRVPTRRREGRRGELTSTRQQKPPTADKSVFFPLFSIFLHFPLFDLLFSSFIFSLQSFLLLFLSFLSSLHVTFFFFLSIFPYTLLSFFYYAFFCKSSSLLMAKLLSFILLVYITDKQS